MQRVHDRLDNLEDCEGNDAVAHQHAEHAPALQLGEQVRGVQDQALSDGTLPCTVNRIRFQPKGPPASRVFAMAVMVLQLRVVTVAAKTLSIVPRYRMVSMWRR